MTNYALNVGDIGPISGGLPVVAFQVPQIADLAGAYILGGGSDIGLVNWANDQAPPLAIGTPVWGDGYAALGRLNYIDTGIDETAAMTMVFAGRRSAAGNVPFMGNYVNDTNIGVFFYGLNSNANIAANADRGASGIGVSVAGNTDEMRLYSITIPATGAMTIRDHTAGTTATGSATGARVVETANKIRIGSSVSTAYQGIPLIAAAAVANRAVTPAELDQIVAWVRKAAAVYGVTV